MFAHRYESDNETKSPSGEHPEGYSPALEIMKPEDIYDLYLDEIVVDNKLTQSTSDIFKLLGRKLNKTHKAAYMLMKRVHDKADANVQTTYNSNGGENVGECGENFGDHEKPPTSDLRCNEAAEKHNKNSSRHHSCNETNVNAANPKKIVIDSYSGQFPNAGIFAIESRRERHRQGTVARNCVKSGWTSKLAALLFKEIDISCKFDFKRAWIVNDGTIRTKGTCDCGSVLEVSSNLKLLCVNITNINAAYDHSRKYQIRGEMKENLSEMLKAKFAKPVQVKFVNDITPNNEELKERFDPITPSLEALRKLRSRQENHGQDTFAQIISMKESEHSDVICFLSHSPFAVFYQTPLQLALYIAETKKGDVSLSVDATGSLVIPPKQSQKIAGSNKLKHIFLYQIMLKSISGKSVPIAQMLSQDHTSEFIQFFLSKIFKQVKSPKEVVCDESKALLKALAATFAKCESIDIYVKQCMGALITSAPKPLIQLRIDRSHFVKNITNKIKDRDHRRRSFFRGVIGYLIQCDDFVVVKKIIEDFFTVILNEYDGADGIGPLPAEVSKKKLLLLLTTFDEQADYDEDDKPADTELDVNENSLWIEEIIDKVPIVREMPKEHHGNLYFSPDDKPFYIRLFSTIALWSNVMNPLFESNRTVASSSDVESNFKTLKTGIIGRRMLSPHTFLKIHIDFVNAEVKLNAGSKKKQSPSSKLRKRSRSLTANSPTAHRKRSSSNQFEYQGIEASVSENGINIIHRHHVVINRQFSVFRTNESAFLFQILFYEMFPIALTSH